MTLFQRIDAGWLDLFAAASQLLFAASVLGRCNDPAYSNNLLGSVACDLGLSHAAVRLVSDAPDRLRLSGKAFRKPRQRTRNPQCVGLLAPPEGKEWTYTQRLAIPFTRWLRSKPDEAGDAIRTFMQLCDVDGVIHLGSGLLDDPAQRTELDRLRRMFIAFRGRQLPELRLNVDHHRNNESEAREIFSALLAQIGIPGKVKMNRVAPGNVSPSYDSRIEASFCREASEGALRLSEGFRYLVHGAYVLSLWDNLDVFEPERRLREHLADRIHLLREHPRSSIDTQGKLGFTAE